MVVTLHLRPHCAKYLRYSCDLEKPIDFSRPFGRMLSKTIRPSSPGRPTKCPDGKIEVQIQLPSTSHYPGIRSDRMNYEVPSDEMHRVDEYLDQLFRFEVMTSVGQRGTLQKKQVFLNILDRFDMTCDDFSFDALAKFDQRYKNKSPNALIFG